jgi:hypothetical protein
MFKMYQYYQSYILDVASKYRLHDVDPRATTKDHTQHSPLIDGVTHRRWSVLILVICFRSASGLDQAGDCISSAVHTVTS